MKRTIRVFSILFGLALVLALSLVVTAPVAAATPIYVNGTTGNDAWDGQAAAWDGVHGPKQTIQAGISVVDAGGTVYVGAGTYSEQLVINKSLTLTGDPGDSAPGPGPSAPILDGGGVVSSAITISGGVSNVIIEGFEITNYRNRTLGTPWTTGGTGSAIEAWSSTAIDDVTVRDNYMHGLGWNAVLVGNEGQALHSNWLVQNNVVGAYAAYAIELTNTQDSSVIGNEIAGGTDILSESSDDSQDAVLIQAQIHTGTGLTVPGVTVEGNTITGPLTRAGIEFLAWDSTNSLVAVLDNITADNNSVSNAERGVFVYSYGANANIDNLDITQNVLDGNFHGVQITDGGGGSHGLIEVVCNEIINSTGTSSGVRLTSGTSATGIAVNRNNISGNALLGVNNGGTGTLDAENNWWGHDSGPYHPTLNSGGLGDDVSDNVDFDPWIKKAVATTTATGDASFSSSEGNIVGLTAVTPPASPPVELPHGMFSFQVCCLPTGGTVTLTVTLPDAVPVGTVWWKYQNGHWYSLPNLSDNGDAIMVISLTDGGSADEDSVPGQITDDGGPGPGGAVGWETYPTDKTRVLLPWIALLAAIAAGVSLLALRRRRTTT